MTTLKQLADIIIKFRDDRDWDQFHSPLQLALSLSLESSEILELFQWKNDNEINELIKDPIFKRKLKEEMSDVLAYLLLLSKKFDIDLEKSFKDKIQANALKYPINKAKGRPTKYTDL